MLPVQRSSSAKGGNWQVTVIEKASGAKDGVASAIRWGWYSIAVDLLLVMLLGAVAAISGSLAVIAELIHNAVDLVAAGAVLAGLKIAARASKVFPYGLYKVENAIAAAIGGMIFFTAFEMAHVIFLGTAAPPRADTWMFAALAVTLILPLVFSYFELRAAKAVNSPALAAQALEYRLHAYTTGLAFAALISSRTGLPADRVAALLIVIAVVKTGWELLSEAMRVLLDASLDAGQLDEIRRIVLADPAVAEVKWIWAATPGASALWRRGWRCGHAKPPRQKLSLNA
jgi:cation diffusion facilitator family transporter